MTSYTQRAGRWLHAGVWRVLAELFRVPPTPPTLPVAAGEWSDSFRPSPKFLDYLKFIFWFWLFIVDALIFAVWIAVTVAEPTIGAWLAVPLLVLALLPDVLAYVAIHLRYDTTWYVMSERSLRCRRGIWIISEHTITFENIQNVAVQRGPLQRWFGLATLVLETAGSGEQGAGHAAVANRAVVEGIENVEQLRARIMERVERSRTAGLGDEHSQDHGTSAALFTPAHVAALRAVRDEAVALVHERRA